MPDGPDVMFTIADRFNGPPRSANGGYACGVIAELAAPAHGSTVAITLLEPPPLEMPMRFHPAPRRSQVYAGDQLVATVVPSPTIPEPPGPVSVELAETAARAYPGGSVQAFRTCFVCGIDRLPDDALLLTPGPVPHRDDTVACTWQPPGWLCGGDSSVPQPVVWAVLDCPGGWAGDLAAEPMVLSRMAARICEPVVARRRYVVVGRRTGRSTRNAVSTTALYSEQGELVAHAATVWTAVDPSALIRRDGASRA